MLQQVTVDARVTFASMRIAVDARCSNVPDATVLPRKNRGNISMWPTESEDQVQCYQGGNAWCTPFRLLSFHSYAQTHAGALHSHERLDPWQEPRWICCHDAFSEASMSFNRSSPCSTSSAESTLCLTCDCGSYCMLTDTCRCKKNKMRIAHYRSHVKKRSNAPLCHAGPCFLQEHMSGTWNLTDVLSNLCHAITRKCCGLNISVAMLAQTLNRVSSGPLVLLWQLMHAYKECHDTVKVLPLRSGVSWEHAQWRRNIKCQYILLHSRLFTVSLECVCALRSRCPNACIICSLKHPINFDKYIILLECTCRNRFVQRLASSIIKSTVTLLNTYAQSTRQIACW